jgi:hypothetical protein
MGLVWRENEEGDYDDSCTRCEIIVSMDAAEHTIINGLLDDDRRLTGSLGRALLQNALVGGVQLLKGDRLEPSAAVPSIESFSKVVVFPLDGVVFWRRSHEIMTRHRNPLVDATIGITPKRCLCVDTLHAFYLGFLKALLQYVMWYLLLSFPYGQIGTLGEALGNNMSAMSHELLVFYKAYDKAHPTRKLTRVGCIDRHLVGTNADRTMTSKGAETYGLMHFVVHLLVIHLDRLSPEAKLLLDACRACLRMVAIWQESSFRVTAQAYQECFDCLNRAYAKTDQIDDLNTPQKHLCVHLVHDMYYFGNPQFYSNFYDENLNKLLKSFCRLVSQCSFESFLLLRMRDGLKAEAPKREAEVL